MTTTPEILATVAKLQERADYIAGLRALADLLDEHTTLPMPYSRDLGLVFVDTKEQLQTYMRAMTGRVDKNINESGGYEFSITGPIAGVSLQVFIRDREQVCTKVVHGTREVTETIPDPTVSVPMITVTKTVEDVEWVCEPLTAATS